MDTSNILPTRARECWIDDGAGKLSGLRGFWFLIGQVYAGTCPLRSKVSIGPFSAYRSLRTEILNISKSYGAPQSASVSEIGKWRRREELDRNDLRNLIRHNQNDVKSHYVRFRTEPENRDAIVAASFTVRMYNKFENGNETRRQSDVGGHIRVGISVMKRTEAFALRLLLPESDPEFDI
jgi:hypothetical protein